MVKIYTDGGYSIPRKKGAWAVVVIEDGKILEEFREEVTDATVNIAELLGMKKALELSTKYNETEIYCDSKYVVDGYNIWMRNWEKFSWEKGDGSPLKNVGLWKNIHSLKHNKVKVFWVKGHNEDEWNEYVDALTKV